VRGSGADSVDYAVVDAIQRLAQAVGAKTIAESVESMDTYERIRRMGIDFAQGHVIHIPEPYPELAERMDYARSCAA
jgi:EAL domain-containing protein (putative c-di-GMP-specific phosphodiesterase class I)